MLLEAYRHDLMLYEVLKTIIMCGDVISWCYENGRVLFKLIGYTVLFEKILANDSA